MGNVRFRNGKLLFNANGQIAMSDDCCCGDESPFETYEGDCHRCGKCCIPDAITLTFAGISPASLSGDPQDVANATVLVNRLNSTTFTVEWLVNHWEGTTDMAGQLAGQDESDGNHPQIFLNVSCQNEALVVQAFFQNIDFAGGATNQSTQAYYAEIDVSASCGAPFIGVANTEANVEDVDGSGGTANLSWPDGQCGFGCVGDTCTCANCQDVTCGECADADDYAACEEGI